MSRKFDFNKDRIGLLAGLIDDDNVEDVRHSLAEDYHRELVDDMKEVDQTLQEYSTSYMGYRPHNSEDEQGVDCECPEKAKPNPEESGLPGWSYYDADPTFQKMATMDRDLQHRKRMQWVAPTEMEAEDMVDPDDKPVTEADATRLLRAKIDKMISEHKLLRGK